MIEALEPGELDRILRDQHVYNMAEEVQRILAARMCGCSVEMIAGRMSMSVGAVYRAIGKVQIAIFSRYGLEHDSWATSRWFSHHTVCCVAFGTGLIETSRIFPRENRLSG